MGPPQYFTSGIPGVGYTPDMDAGSLTGKNTLKRRPTVETSGVGKKRRVVLTNRVAPRQSLNVSEARHEVQLYDKHLLANQGTQRLTSLSMNCGSRLPHVDKYGPFLKNLNQNGRIVMNWTGTLETTKINDRHVSMQMFRHSLSNNVYNLKQGSYPSNISGGVNPHILMPASANNLSYIPDVTDVPAAGDVIQNPFYKHFDGQVSYAPANLPDLEDMSWNLNKLKLAPSNKLTYDENTVTSVFTGDPQTFAGALVPLPMSGPDYTPTGVVSVCTGTVTSTLQPNALSPQFLNNVPNYQHDMHRRQSQLRQNNYEAVNTTALSATAGDRYTSNYIFDACLRNGSIEFEFMNKKDVGAHVEVIVYGFKKSQPLSAEDSRYSVPYNLNTSGPAVEAYYPLNYIVDGISKGYMDTVGQDYATENFQGRPPVNTDIYNNANFPLLPNKLKKTVEGDLPSKEIMRNKFAMSAGSRRSVTIKLPGVKYNPAAKPVTDAPRSLPGFNNSNQLNYNAIPCIDPMTYGVVLSVHGQKMTRFFDNLPKSAGDATGVPGQILSWRFNILDPVSTIWLADNVVDGNGNDAYPVGDVLKFFLVSPNGGVAAQYSSVNTIQQALAPPLGAPLNFTRFITYLTPPPTFQDQYTLYQSGSKFEVASNYNCYAGTVDGPVLSVFQSTLAPAIPYQPSVSVDDVSELNPGSAAVAPNELPMGDNFGLAHIDYSCQYTEHIGSCVYHETSERNLYDCGQGYVPNLVSTSGSIEASRMILPAVDVVRQAKRYGFDVDSSGAPQNLSVDNATSGN